MNIGIACKSFRQSGGLERYALDIIGGLNRLGIRPVVFARSFDPALLARYDIVPQRIGVSLLPGKLRDHYFSRRVATLRKRLGVDVLIGVDRTACADIAICGGTHRGFLQACARAPGRADEWQIGLEAAQYRHAGKIVAHSQMMVDELRTLYDVPVEKIALLYPPVDASRFTPGDAAQRAHLRERFGLPRDKLVFLFPSSSHERKGYAQLAEFFERTTLPVMLAVAGRPVETSSAAIRYLGYQPNMADLYRAVDYSILASRYEPFGLIGIESILCGTPVVLNARIACTEVLSSEACLTFDATQPGALARAVADAVERHAGFGMAGARELGKAIHYDPDIDRHVAALMSLLALAKVSAFGATADTERGFQPRAAA
ncbi:glycosyltransferase family 4 protein [Robbsia sp. Bb-Pol-6]|uniref:Glycosyltransferase family 4 protein n=1 Tax=Robbsia betulipollinis TaxID=2981849 RepID=A0ABT3ZP47_9BURK|nr:glycosyltransferase family 4 protein [Robbsia betulipollinis]MCY0387710.1 glycosyltransferase family 4 protein [Robbsia betulipollinis]